MSMPEEMSMAMKEINKQSEAVQRLLLDCPDYYTRMVEAATDLELKSAVKVGRKYLTGNEVRLLAMEEELEKRQKKEKNQEQDKKNCKINTNVGFKGQVKDRIIERNKRNA